MIQLVGVNMAAHWLSQMATEVWQDCTNFWWVAIESESGTRIICGPYRTRDHADRAVVELDLRHPWEIGCRSFRS